MKISILVVLVFLLYAILMVPSCMAKMTVDWSDGERDLSGYQEMYVHNIDLREMKYKVYDDEEDEYDEELLSNDALDRIALDIYEHFYIQLKDVIQINEAQEINADAKALILNIKLSAQFITEYESLMLGFIFGKKDADTLIYLECEVLDAQDKSLIVIIKDEHNLKSPVQESPLSKREEFDTLSEIFRVWATRFGKVVELAIQGSR